MIDEPITGMKVMVIKIAHMDNPDWIKKPQVIEDVWEVPILDEHGADRTTYMIDVAGIPYIFDENDLEEIK